MALPDVDDVYKIVLRVNYITQEIVNVFYYRDTAIAGFTPISVAQGFWDNCKTQWRAYMPAFTSVFTYQVDCEALYGAHAFGSYSIPAAEQLGLRAVGGSQEVTPVVAAAIRMNVGTRVTRPGSKRLAGLLESDINFDLLAAGTVTLVQAIADKWDVTFIPTGGGAATVAPVIVGYPTLLQPGAPRVQDVTSAIALQKISHQVSRDTR